MTQFSINSLDLPTLVSHLHRNAVGFDQMFDGLNQKFVNSKQDGNYPPHNIIKIDDTHYAIQLAVAGFAESELDIEFKEKQLVIRGEQKDREDIEYLHQGISARDFVRTFTLAEHVHVTGATVVNGILAVSLELVVPEELQPKKIAITFTK